MRAHSSTLSALACISLCPRPALAVPRPEILYPLLIFALCSIGKELNDPIVENPMQGQVAFYLLKKNSCIHDKSACMHIVYGIYPWPLMPNIPIFIHCNAYHYSAHKSTRL